MADKSVSYSLNFLQAIQESLHIDLDDAGRATVNVNRISAISLQKLATWLRDLLEPRVILDAVGGAEGYPATQTTGVGYAADYDAFVRLGLLIGQRVVLWETLLIAQLFDPRGVQRDSLLSTAVQLMELKPLVEQGGAVLLPHPQYWSERYQYYLRAIDGIEVSNAFLGLLNARALVEDQFEVHPYTWHEDFESVRDWARRLAPDKITDQAKEEVAFGMQHLIADEVVYYIQNVSLVEFFAATRDAAFQSELRTRLRLQEGDPYASPEAYTAREERIRDAAATVVSGLRQQERRIAMYQRKIAMEATASAAGVAKTAGEVVTLVHDGPSVATALGLLGGGTGTAIAIQRLLKTIWGQPENCLVFQVFGELRSVEAEERLGRLRTIAEMPYALEEPEGVDDPLRG